MSEQQLRRQRQLDAELEIERLRLQRLAEKDKQEEMFQREMANRFIYASLLGINQIMLIYKINALFKLQMITVISALAVSMALADSDLRIVILLGIVLPCLTLPKNNKARFTLDLTVLSIISLASYIFINDLSTWSLLAFIVLTVPVIAYIILGGLIYPIHLYIRFRHMKND